MPLRPLPFREVVRKLEAAGFSEASQKRGSHVKFVKRAGDDVTTAVVPRHREVAWAHCVGSCGRLGLVRKGSRTCRGASSSSEDSFRNPGSSLSPE